jgi:uncharacterized cupredoxin-like copper-binding protein
MRRAPRLLIAAASLAVLGLVAACGGDDEATESSREAAPASAGGLASGGETAAVQTLEAVVPGGDGGEFSFTATPDLVAGPVEISLTNHGALEHQAMVMRFRTTTQVLEAGDYMLICVLPGQDGAPHAAHGMVLPFTVADADTPVDATTATGIDADHDVRLVDFGFVYEGTLSAGETIHVVNDGDQAHELVAYRLQDGATAEDVAAAMASPGSGPPPASAGVGMLDPGRAVDLALPDEPGEYVLFCMLPDVAGDALPHIAHGMLSPATIA